MAIYHVSGGGDALNLRLINSSTAASSVIYVHPGVYNPISVYWNRNNLSIIGLDRDECVIEGKPHPLTASSLAGNVASTIIDSMANNAVLSNMTFRNGLVDMNNQPKMARMAIIAASTTQYIYDCNIYDCSCIVSSSANARFAKFIFNMEKGVHNSHISNVIFNGSDLIQYTTFHNCEIHDVSCVGTQYLNNNMYSRWLQGNNNYIHDCQFNSALAIGGNANCSILENCRLLSSITTVDMIYAYNYQTINNCLFINNSGWRRFSAYGNCIRNCVFVGNSWADTNNNAGKGYNWYRPDVTGTSANYVVRMNNAFDVPLTSIYNMQAAMNNSFVDGKYVCISGNMFNMKLSDCGFVDPDNHDYRLKPTSPLISAGICFSDYAYAYSNPQYPKGSRDLDKRRFKDPPSMGPYQYYKALEGEIPNYINPVGANITLRRSPIHVRGGGTALRTAIANAKNGDTILVYDGVYTGSSLTLRSSNISSLTIRSVNGPDNCIVKFHTYYYDGEYELSSLTDTSWKTNNYLSAYGLTFKGYNTGNGQGLRRFVCVNCIIDSLSGNYGVAANSACLINCVVKNCFATQYDRLCQKAFVYNCVFMNNHTPSNNAMFYNSSMHNYICAGNTYGSSNMPITGITSKYYANGMNVSVSDLDASGRPIAGSECYGAGNAVYLQTSSDFVGTPWKSPPAIGAFEEIT